MSGDLTVRSRLEMTTNVPQVMRDLIAACERANRAIGTTQDLLDKLGRSRSGVNQIVRSLTKLADVKLNAAFVDQLSGAATKTKDMAAQTEAMAAAAKEAATAWREIANAKIPSNRMPPAPPTPSMPRSGSGSHGSRTALMDTAIGGQIVGDAGWNVMAQGFMAQAELQQQIALLQADKRVTGTVIAKLGDTVARLQKQYPALQQLEAYKLFGENQGIFGDPAEALATLPASVRLQQLYQLRSTGQGGTGGDENLAATKAGDALQAFINPKTKQVDATLFEKWIDFQTKSVLAGGGIVDAKSWLTYARTARASGIGYNQDALEYTQALLELSPGRTGTALQSAFQLFGASTATLSKKNRAAWQQMGLIDKKGNLTDAAGFQDDPYTWVWNTLLPDLAKHGVKTRQQILAWLSAHGQRSTVAGVLSDIAIGETNIEKTKARFDAQDPNTGSTLANTDIGKLQALYAAENNFLIALGKFEEGPGVKILEGLTGGLNSLTDWMTKHSTLAKDLVLIGGGMVILSKAASTLALTIYLGAPVVQGMGALAKASASFASGGAAARGLATVASFMTKLSSLITVLSLSGDTPQQQHKEGDVSPSGMDTWHNGHWQRKQYKDGDVLPGGKWTIHHNGFLGMDYVTPATAADRLRDAQQSNSPVPVHVVNGKDIADGTTASIARKAQRPPSAPTFGTPSLSPYYPGMMGGLQ